MVASMQGQPAPGGQKRQHRQGAGHEAKINQQYPRIMTSIIRNISQMAMERIQEEFPAVKCEITSVNIFDQPTRNVTLFLMVADIDSQMYTGSGGSGGKAVDDLIKKYLEVKR